MLVLLAVGFCLYCAQSFLICGSPKTSTCRLSTISKFSSPSQLQHHPYQQPRSHSRGALTLSAHPILSSVAQSYVPKCLVIPEFPSWPFRCREPPATLAWPPSAFCCLYIDSASAWSRPLGSTKCPNQAPSWFKCFWLQILWEFGDKKKIYLQMQFYIYWWVGAAFRPYEANLRLESQCGRSSVSHLLWGLHCSCLWTVMSLPVSGIHSPLRI